MDPKVEPMKHLKAEKAAPPPVLWTPWGPQKFTERDAQLAAIRRLIRKVEKLQPGKLGFTG
jgi:hypothetical protein